MTLTFRISGLLEAMDKATRYMKDPKGHSDNGFGHEGQWKVISSDDVEKIAKEF